MSLDEEAVLLRHCDLRLRTLVLAAVDTGFWAGESKSLRWQAVDLQRSYVSVATCYTNNGEPRSNPLTKRLEQALLEWRAATGGRADDFVSGPQGYRKVFE